MKHIALVASVLIVAACAPQHSDQTALAIAPTVAPPAPLEVPAGEYSLDKSHATLHFRVNHLGFSNYTAGFGSFDAQLNFDPANLATSNVTAHIALRSLTLPTPPAGFVDQLLSANWLDAEHSPEMTYVSTHVDVIDNRTFNVTGNLTLHGVTKPVTMHVVLNGGYKGHPMDPHARIGFSAHGRLQRSEFGIAAGIPEPGSTMGVGDAVDFSIEAEFSGPPLAPNATPAA